MKLMNCIRCHHTDESHESTENDSLVKRGKCMIPILWIAYSILKLIKKIDEDLYSKNGSYMKLTKYIGMEKHIPLDNTIKDLDNIMSRVNGLEVSSTDEYQIGNGKCAQNACPRRNKPVQGI